MGGPKTHKSTKSASSQASTSSRKREQDQEVAAEPSPSVAATYGSYVHHFSSLSLTHLLLHGADPA